MDVMYAVFAGAKNCLLQLLAKVGRRKAKRCETVLKLKTSNHQLNNTPTPKIQ